MIINDKTIFSYLKPMHNEMMTKISYRDLDEILFYLDKYYLEYRDNLGLSKVDTFGIEIEFEHFVGFGRCNFNEFDNQLAKVVGNNRWDSKNDLSLFRGREIVSEILNDDIKNWNNIKKVCELAYKNGKIDKNSSSHVHVGSQILGENTLYWYRFFKLWSIYENVIYRFCYGEYLTYRPKILKYARPAALFFDERLKRVSDKLDCSLLEMLMMIEPKGKPSRYTKNFGVSYWRMLADDNYDRYEDFNRMNNGCTLEFRAPNGTFDEIIWQNNINFFIKMINYCKSDKYDDDILERRKRCVQGDFSNLMMYSDIYMDQVLEFVDMIFDNNLDKIYFLRQYLKSMQVLDGAYVKAKKMTMTNR